MTDSEFFDLLDSTLSGSEAIEGEEFTSPQLLVYRYHRRAVRIGWLPVVGKVLSVVATVQRPRDLPRTAEGFAGLLRRVAMAANGKFPPRPLRHGLTIGLTTVILERESLQPGDDAMLAGIRANVAPMRCVPLGMILVNDEQEAMSFSLRGVSDPALDDPGRIVDGLDKRFRRFVPMFTGE